uniref:Uncharacterized protein n=1 Tax=Acrobeloides nanus TaxID=290746 RepID=A0A914E6L2_9BILA
MNTLLPKDGVYSCSECKELKNQYNLPYQLPKVEVRDGKVIGNVDEGHFCKPEVPNYPGHLIQDTNGKGKN